MNQVFVCGTYFHVFISLLRVIHRQDRNSKSLIVINDRMPQVQKILEPLRQSNYFNFVVYIPFGQIAQKIKKEGNLLSRKFNRNQLYIDFVSRQSEISTYDDFIRNAEINLFSNAGLSSGYFLLRYKQNFIRMLEDGEGNYISRVSPLKAFKRKYILRTPVGEGLDDAVKEIHVQHPDKLNPRIRKKGVKLELRKMSMDLQHDDIEKILRIFMSGVKINLCAGKKLLLITQPLSEDQHMAESQKLELYNKILKPFAGEYTFFLKPHPRELTDYEGKLNYPFTIIPQTFPLELFGFIKEIHFELCVAVSSSSINNLDCCDEKIQVGREYFKKPLPDNWYEVREKS